MTPEKTKSLLQYWVPPLAFASLIFWLSSQSSVPEMPDYTDKFVHFIEYFILALLLWRALARQQFWVYNHRNAMTMAILATAYAASDEIHQSFVPGRYASLSDWIADVAGILGMLTLVLIRVKWRRRGDKHGYETI